MAAIRPISELRNNFNDVASLCNKKGEVYITRNGFGAYVLMTMDAYEEQKAQLALYHKLAQAEAQVQNGRFPMKRYSQVSGTNMDAKNSFALVYARAAYENFSLVAAAREGIVGNGLDRSASEVAK